MTQKIHISEIAHYRKEDRERAEACIGIFRAAAATVIELSRDDGLSLRQYRELEQWLEATLVLFRKHRGTRYGYK